MARWTVAIAVALVTALVGVAVASARFLDEDRARRLDAFADVRRKQVVEAARVIQDELAGIGRDLTVLGQLMQARASAQDGPREVAALMDASPQYRLVRVYDDGGRALITAAADDASGIEGTEPVMREVVRKALAGEVGTIHTTPPLSTSGTDWFRIFAWSFERSGRSRGVVALLVDTEPLFRKLRIVAADPGAYLLLLGIHGRPVPVTHPAIANALVAVAEDHARFPEFSSLVHRMREGASGKTVIPAEEAAQMGLPRADVVVAYASIPADAGNFWSIATLNSTEALRAEREAITMRVSVAAGALALALLGMGALLLWTGRRSIEVRERLRHAERLAHLHEKTEKILDTIPSAVMALGLDGRVTSGNLRVREKLGVSSVEGTLEEVLRDAPPAIPGKLRSLVDGAVASGRVRSIHGERVALFGHEGQYSIHAVPLEPRYPEARALLVIEDQSQVRALESQLLRAEKLSTVGVLAAGIAHEVGTPLSIVRGRARYVLGKLGPEHPQVNGLRVIIEQIDLVTRTIRQLLDFSRVKPPQAHAVSLAAAAHAIQELLAIEADRRKVKILVDAPDDLPLVQADADQVQQLLVNLVMNALDACAEGGTITLRATTIAASDETGWRSVRLQVIDDGVGIPEELRARVFDPFFTTKKRGQGTGLGLAVAAQIVRNHGADIELESETGKGTTVTVRWPLPPQESTDGTGPGAQGAAADH